MLENPLLADDRIAACLHAHFGVLVTGVNLLPLGADPNSVVYRAAGADGAAYFVQLRRGGFQRIGLLLPRHLGENGVLAIISAEGSEYNGPFPRSCLVGVP